MPNPASSLNAGQVRAAIDPACRRRSLGRALVVVMPCVALYVASAAATIAVPYVWARPLCSLLTGFFGALLFGQAHDAAHGSLTPYRWLNGLLGRLLFLPAGHPFTGWVHAHNHIHHGWTNFVPKDYVWAPLSKQDYDRLPAWRRVLVRLYRWWPGFGLYYGWEILAGKIMLPQPEVRNRKQRMVWWLDLLFVATGTLLVGCGVVALGRVWQPAASGAWLIFWVQVVPFAVIQWIVGFITYLHHTHPQIAWFKNSEEWSFYNGQVLGTTHTRFPSRLNAVMQHILEHTAHHVDPRIPMYHLVEAQADLKAAFGNDVLDPAITFRNFFYTQRVCQLYDFENHRWLSYRGQYTSSRTFQPSPSAVSAILPFSAQTRDADSSSAAHPRARA